MAEHHHWLLIFIHDLSHRWDINIHSLRHVLTVNRFYVSLHLLDVSAVLDFVVIVALTSRHREDCTLHSSIDTSPKIDSFIPFSSDVAVYHTRNLELSAPVEHNGAVEVLLLLQNLMQHLVHVHIVLLIAVHDLSFHRDVEHLEILRVAIGKYLGTHRVLPHDIITQSNTVFRETLVTDIGISLHLRQFLNLRTDKVPVLIVHTELYDASHLVIRHSLCHMRSFQSGNSQNQAQHSEEQYRDSKLQGKHRRARLRSLTLTHHRSLHAHSAQIPYRNKYYKQAYSERHERSHALPYNELTQFGTTQFLYSHVKDIGMNQLRSYARDRERHRQHHHHFACQQSVKSSVVRTHALAQSQLALSGVEHLNHKLHEVHQSGDEYEQGDKGDNCISCPKLSIVLVPHEQRNPERRSVACPFPLDSTKRFRHLADCIAVFQIGCTLTHVPVPYHRHVDYRGHVIGILRFSHTHNAVCLAPVVLQLLVIVWVRSQTQERDSLAYCGCLSEYSFGKCLRHDSLALA